MGKLLSIIVNNSHLRIAELAEGRHGVSVYRLLSKEVPENLVAGGVILDVKGFAEFLTATLRYANIKTRKIVVSLASDKIMSREVVLPELSEEKLMIAVRANASDYFPIDLSDYVLAYFPISKITKDDGEMEEADAEAEGKRKSRKKKKDKKRDKDGKQSGRRKNGTRLRLMVVAAPNDLVQSYYDLARQSHLKLVSLDYNGNSLFQITSDQVGEEPSLVIQVDEERTVLTIYDENVMVLQRQVDFGSSAVIQTVMDLQNVDYETAREQLYTKELIRDSFDEGDEVTENLYYLVSNIKRIIEYYTGRNTDRPLEQVCLMGAGSAMIGLDHLLEKQLYLPVEAITTLKSVIVKESTGLSMREVISYMDNIGAVIAPVGLLPKQLEQDIRRKLEAKAYRVMILLALFASVVIVSVPASKFFNTAMDTLDLQNKLLLLEDVKPILDNYDQAVARHTDVRQVQVLTRTENESLLSFINIFEQLRPSNISIESFACSNGKVSFTAAADGKKTVAKLVQQLNIIANVSEVQVSGLSSAVIGDQETVVFSVTCKIDNTDMILYGNTTGEAVGNLKLESGKTLDETVDEMYTNLNGSPYAEAESGGDTGAGVDGDAGANGAGGADGAGRADGAGGANGDAGAGRAAGNTGGAQTEESGVQAE